MVYSFRWYVKHFRNSKASANEIIKRYRKLGGKIRRATAMQIIREELGRPYQEKKATRKRQEWYNIHVLPILQKNKYVNGKDFLLPYLPKKDEVERAKNMLNTARKNKIKWIVFQVAKATGKENLPKFENFMDAVKIFYG